MSIPFMFHFQNGSCQNLDEIPKDFNVFINGEEYLCSRWASSKISNSIKRFINENQKSPFSQKSERFKINLEDSGDIRLIVSLLCGQPIDFTTNSLTFLMNAAHSLEMELVLKEVNCIYQRLEYIEEQIDSDDNFSILCSIEKKLFNANNEIISNIDLIPYEIIDLINSIEIFDVPIIDSDDCFIENPEIIKLTDKNHQNRMQLLSNLILNVLIERIQHIDQYFKVLYRINDILVENGFDPLLPIFCDILLNKFKQLKPYSDAMAISQELCFIVYKLIEKEGIFKKDISFQNLPLFFAHLMNESQLKARLYFDIRDQTETFLTINKKNDFEIHRQFIQKGMNPDEIMTMIRFDDVSKVQNEAMKTNFDFNAKIQSSIYEQCSFVNSPLTYLEISAFFGSIKCFKFLLMNGAELTPNLPKYAIGGGNLEIIHICDQKECNFKDTLRIALKYHHHKIFKWLINTKSLEYWKDLDLIKDCFYFQNYKSLAVLLKKGIDLSLVLIESVKNNNLILTRFCSSINNNTDKTYMNINTKDEKGKTPLQIACINNNADIVTILLEDKNIDINSCIHHDDGKRILFLF
ncbi:hypothetical protein TRFO_31612 [Tritrichomonas foetus]|uniref:DUF3447 domain-containing protein n=1 Tax=Tritrichomonas foetus TaxID=1144522 RepID=A0A1J4JSV9_9EUKA|nr:hypothetical protein TRFO_31612 [Tritrichomonas foetus]|eukprot:OHT01520.1 hypothetical protein TRFO_31612 [Tritrichomonas foetus]